MKSLLGCTFAALILSIFSSTPSQARPASDDELANFQVSVAEAFTKGGASPSLAIAKCSAQSILVKYVDDQDPELKGSLQTIKLPIHPAVLVVSSMAAEISDQDPNQVIFSESSHHESVVTKIIVEFSVDKKSIKYLAQQDYSIQQAHGPLILDGEALCGDAPKKSTPAIPQGESKPPVPPPSPKPIITKEDPKPAPPSPLPVPTAAPVAPKAEANPTNLSKAKQVIKNDLTQLSQFNFEHVSNLHQEIFGGSDASSVIKFFTDRVHRIVWQQDTSRGVMAAVYPGTDTMAVGAQLFSDVVPQIIRLSTYVHEARHTEPNGGWPHSFCPKPYNFVLNSSLSFRLRTLENSSDEQCDKQALGAYGVEYVFLRSVVNSCTNCSEKMKLDAKLYADYQTITRIMDPAAVDQLLRNGNLDFNEATREVAQVLSDKLQSGLIFMKWVKQCENNQASCLGQ